VGFFKTEVTRFYNNMEELMMKYKFPPTHIFNMDETGISAVQDHGLILAPKVQKRVGSIKSWEQGKTRYSNLQSECKWELHSPNAHFSSTKYFSSSGKG
jgi:hypothetical protein